AVLARSGHRHGIEPDRAVPAAPACRIAALFQQLEGIPAVLQGDDGLPDHRLVQGYLLGHSPTPRFRHDRIPRLRHAHDASRTAAAGGANPLLDDLRLTLARRTAALAAR